MDSSKCNEGIIDILIAAGMDLEKGLIQASFKSDTKVMKLFLEAGADPNVRDRGNITPLHYASSDGHIEMVRCLIAAGADKNAHDKCGQMLLHYARNEIVKFLLDADP